MRILHVIQELGIGGAERIAVRLAHAAREAGNDVAVASYPGELVREFPGPHFHVPLVQRRPWRLPAAAHAVDKALRAFKPDLVHCHNPGMAAVTAIATARGRRVPTIVSVHGVPEEDWPTTVRVLRLAGLASVACGPAVETALAEHGLTPDATIANGISPPPQPAGRDVLEHEFGIAHGQSVFVAVGRLAPEKNYGLAIRAVADVPDAALLIVGDGPERASLEELAANRGIAARVHLPGIRADARSLMGAADAALFTSKAEGLPLAALEALASGTPLVAVAVRGLRELLVDGENALLVPPDDEAALSAALRRVVSDRGLARTVGGRGRLLAREYSEERMTSAFLALYRDRARR